MKKRVITRSLGKGKMMTMVRTMMMRMILDLRDSDRVIIKVLQTRRRIDEEADIDEKITLSSFLDL